MRNFLIERVAANAGGPEMDPAEGARVRNLRHSGGEARKGTGAGPNVGRDDEWSVVPNSPVKTVAPAPLTLAWAEGYSGWLGVPGGKKSSQGVHAGSGSVAGIEALELEWP